MCIRDRFKVQPAEQRFERGRLRIFRNRRGARHALGLCVAAVTVHVLFLPVKQGKDALRRLRLRGGAHQRDRMSVQVARGLHAAARQPGAHHDLINGIAHMGEREARHAGDSSVIQLGMQIIHYCSSVAFSAAAAFAASAFALAAAACLACISLNFAFSSSVGTGSMQPFGQALAHILQFLHLS